MIRRRLVASAVAILVALLVAIQGIAAAQNATSEQVRDLAERALVDPSALGELTSIRTVDGRPVDLERALGSADGDVRAARLRALARAGSVPSIDADDARGRASRILEGRKYNATEPPRPFRGILNAIGDFLDRYFSKPIGRALKAIADPISRAWDAFVSWVPGGAVTAWTLVLSVILALIAFVVWRLAKRRARTIFSVAHPFEAGERRGDPADLERRADEAESAGDLAEAIRLRFVAGLLRLDRAGAIEFHDALTAGQVRRRLRFSSFDWIASTFEGVAYGDATPDPAAVENTKSAWRDVLERVAA